GNIVQPAAANFQAAAANADWANAPGFNVVLTNQPGDNSWPITAATYILMYKNPKYPRVAQAALRFFDWAYQSGNDMAAELDYVPMPTVAIKLMYDEWSRIKGEAGQPLWPLHQ